MKIDTLQTIINNSVAIDNPPPLQALIDHLLDQHDRSIQAILFYGSCLRSMDLYDGLADFYIVVDNYPAFYNAYSTAMANWALPPNVYYLEIPGPDNKILRAKYAVISQKDFIKGTSNRWFHSYLWGRFTQPVTLPYTKSDAVKNIITECLSNAIITFLSRTIPNLKESGTIHELWEQAMIMSYRAELRAETSQRASTLIKNQPEYYKAITSIAAKQTQLRLTVNGTRYSTNIPPLRRYLSRLTWRIRIIHGKILSVLRLLKALFTFNGGLDYIAWKLERHSGKTVQIPDRVKKYPLIFIWGLFWKLYRQGVFR